MTDEGTYMARLAVKEPAKDSTCVEVWTIPLWDESDRITLHDDVIQAVNHALAFVLV